MASTPVNDHALATRAIPQGQGNALPKLSLGFTDPISPQVCAYAICIYQKFLLTARVATV